MSWKISVVSLANGCRPILSLALLRGRAGEGLMGETCKIDRFGSRADKELELASMYEFTSD